MEPAVGQGPLLSLQELAWAPPGGEPVLAGVSLELWPGQVAWLQGPSGSGKSTLLRLINRLYEPSGGDIEFGGLPLGQWPPAKLRRKAALLQQTPVMLAGSVERNLRLPFGLRAGAAQPPPGGDDLRGLLADMGLAGLALSDQAAPLSVGQRQRIALARLLLMNPDLLLLDEPLAALDPESKEIVERAVARRAARGAAAILVSHQEPAQAGELRRLRLSEGRLSEQP